MIYAPLLTLTELLSLYTPARLFPPTNQRSNCLAFQFPSLSSWPYFVFYKPISCRLNSMFETAMDLFLSIFYFVIKSPAVSNGRTVSGHRRSR
jgi:hypothetical protein